MCESYAMSIYVLHYVRFIFICMRVMLNMCGLLYGMVFFARISVFVVCMCVPTLGYDRTRVLYVYVNLCF